MYAEFLIAFCAFVVTIGLIQRSLEKRKLKKLNLKQLPGPIPLPIIGCIGQLAFLVRPFQLHFQRIHAFCKIYGKTMGMQVGMQYFICTEDKDTIKEIMNSSDWTSRFPDIDLYKEHTYGKNLGLMWSSGNSWKEMRRFSIRTLKNFGFGELKSADVFLKEELDCFLSKINEDIAKNASETFMREYFKIPTFNILWRVMSGYRFSYDSNEMKQLIHYVEEAAQIQVGADLEWAFPGLRWIPWFAKSKQKKYCFDGVHAFFEDIMKKRRMTGEFRISQNDYIDYFLLRIEDEMKNPKSFYTDEQFVSTCADLLFGGVDTTANSMEFTILYMTKFPHVQEKVREEVYRVMGNSRHPESTDRVHMPYTEATMLEISRHANIVPVNGRTAVRDTSLNGCFVPKNALAGINLTILHMSEEIWDEPKEFRPERFISKDGQSIINEDKIHPFGAGKRICLGYSMAKVIWFSFFTRLIQLYKFEPSAEHPVLDITPNGGIANTAKPFYCKIIPIQS